MPSKGSFVVTFFIREGSSDISLDKVIDHFLGKKLLQKVICRLPMREIKSVWSKQTTQSRNNLKLKRKQEEQRFVTNKLL